MSSKLNVLLNLLTFDDCSGPNTIQQYPSAPTSQVSLRDYNLCVTGVSQVPFNVGPNSSYTVFDASSGTNLNNTAQFSITSSGSAYQIFQTAGTNAGFRTLRTINLGSDSAFNVTVNNSALVTYTLSAGTSFTTTSVIAGDILYIDAASPFAAGNKGSFPIISSTTNSVSVQNTNAVAQSSVTLGASYASQFKIFSANGVQNGDTLKISAGFSPSTWGDYVVQNVTDNTVYFNSTSPLAIETNVTPGASGLTFYSSSPFYTYGSGNQPAQLLFDGEASGSVVEPITEGFSTVNWFFLKSGSNYRLVLKNTSAVNTLSGSFFLAQRK